MLIEVAFGACLASLNSNVYCIMSSPFCPGVIACNGVNGAAKLPDGTAGFGIQASADWLFCIHVILLLSGTYAVSQLVPDCHRETLI